MSPWLLPLCKLRLYFFSFFSNPPCTSHWNDRLSWGALYKEGIMEEKCNPKCWSFFLSFWEMGSGSHSWIGSSLMTKYGKRLCTCYLSFICILWWCVCSNLLPMKNCFKRFDYWNSWVLHTYLDTKPLHVTCKSASLVHPFIADSSARWPSLFTHVLMSTLPDIIIFKQHFPFAPGMVFSPQAHIFISTGRLS